MEAVVRQTTVQRPCEAMALRRYRVAAGKVRRRKNRQTEKDLQYYFSLPGHHRRAAPSGRSPE